MKERVKKKQDEYIALIGNRLDREKEVNVVRYSKTRKITKKFVTLAKTNAYERLY